MQIDILANIFFLPPTLWFQKRVMAGKKIVWVENGLNIGSRDSGLGLIIKVRDILLSASKI